MLCKETHAFRQMLAGTLFYCLVVPAVAADNTQAGQDVETTPFPPYPAAALIRIVVKDGRIIEVEPVGGSPKAADAAVDLVKKKWEFSPKQNLIVLLPVKVQQAK